MGLLSFALDGAATTADLCAEMFGAGEGAGPVGAALAATMHAGHAAYDVATGDDKGALSETIETGGAMLGAIPGVGIADVLGGAILSGGEPTTMSGMAGESLADAVFGDDYEPKEVSTMGTIGSAAGALLGLTGGPMGMIGGANTGRDLGEQANAWTDAGASIFSGLFD